MNGFELMDAETGELLWVPRELSAIFALYEGKFELPSDEFEELRKTIDAKMERPEFLVPETFEEFEEDEDEDEAEREVREAVERVREAAREAGQDVDLSEVEHFSSIVDDLVEGVRESVDREDWRLVLRYFGSERYALQALAAEAFEARVDPCERASCW